MSFGKCSFAPLSCVLFSVLPFCPVNHLPDPALLVEKSGACWGKDGFGHFALTSVLADLYLTLTVLC